MFVAGPDRHGLGLGGRRPHLGRVPALVDQQRLGLGRDLPGRSKTDSTEPASSFRDGRFEAFGLEYSEVGALIEWLLTRDWQSFDRLEPGSRR